jgi:hypothetical protein
MTDENFTILCLSEQVVDQCYQRDAKGAAVPDVALSVTRTALGEGRLLWAQAAELHQATMAQDSLPLVERLSRSKKGVSELAQVVAKKLDTARGKLVAEISAIRERTNGRRFRRRRSRSACKLSYALTSSRSILRLGCRS